LLQRGAGFVVPVHLVIEDAKEHMRPWQVWVQLQCRLNGLRCLIEFALPPESEGKI
jgi:hypothetical protein